MKRRRLSAAVAACAVSAALACGGLATGCAQEKTDPILDISDTSGGVAATVNGVEIGENAITAYIENFRSLHDLEDDDSWGNYMIDYSYTCESLRGAVVDLYIDHELLLQAAEQEGVSVTDEEVQEGVETARARFDSDEDWQEALSTNGLTETTYYDQVKMTLLQDAMIEKLGADVSAADDEVLDYVQTYAGTYDGSKRSSHILFAADDKETAQEVLDRINAGELDFAEAAREYSIDEASAADGGDVGWDASSTFIDEYQEALDGLEVGEVSGLVTSENGIHIIMCTDQFEAPETIESLDDVSEGFVETMRETADQVAKTSAYSQYMIDFEEAADIQTEGLPDDASYIIDLTPYEDAAFAADAEVAASIEEAEEEDDVSESGEGDSGEDSEEESDEVDDASSEVDGSSGNSKTSSDSES